ncbi:hypothetical protein CICLE_v10033428mg [Citrus x clementina]|uniref:BHLH domain-containing protein n=1 Tax=Citrus clementina TaxID=85681 RepID=V4TP13_CITCL|nr:hypothetical protein CICLE_v10033428mg [Citrus x clementina]
MRDLEKAVEWLRPFVDSKAWDYCVVWKLGDDPSSGGVGGGFEYVKVKEESGEEQKFSFCRDAHLKHSARTKACEALAQLPSFMDLYSGFLLHFNKVIECLSFNDKTTYLFQISKDQNIIELVLAHCNTSIEQRVVPAGSSYDVGLDEKCLDILLKENLQNFPSPLQLLTFVPGTQVLSAATQFNTHPYNEGSSRGSNPSIEHPSFDSNYGYIAQNAPLMQPIGNSFAKRPKCKSHVFKEELGERHRLGRAKNLITERNRRNKLKDGLFALRALVPKISKMDRAAILGDAAEYIKELLQEVDKLQDELKENEDCEKDNEEMKSFKLDEIHEGTSTTYLPASEHNKSFPACGEKGKSEVRVEVNQINDRDFLIKLLCEHERGGFVRLMEAINSLELQVIDANVTTFNGKVLNILRVQAHKENIRLKKLRETLIELTG